MENKKGSGVFLGIVSVATLIVAIIGATFAYFSASTESNEGAIGLQAYDYKLSLSVAPVYLGGGSALIPLNPNTKPQTMIDGVANYIKKYEVDAEGNKKITEWTTNPSEGINNLLYAINLAENECIDDSGMQVCALYQVTIKNDATNDITMSGTLKTTSNNRSSKSETRTPFSNLTYQEITGDHEQHNLAIATEMVDGHPVNKAPITLKETVGEFVQIGNIYVPGGKIDEETRKFVPGEGKAYILIYLNDTAGNQSNEMGASFTGQLTYTSSEGGGTTLTGTFKVAAPETTE